MNTSDTPSFVKDPNTLSKSELVTIIEQLRHWLYVEVDEDDQEYWNPDKEWDSAADFIEFVDDQLRLHDLVPRADMTMAEAYDVLQGEVERLVGSPNATLFNITHYIRTDRKDLAEIEFVRDSDKLGPHRSVVERVLKALGLRL